MREEKGRPYEDGGKLQGAIALADIVRPEAKQAIDALKASKIRCMMP